jgi:hypothetical protein
MLSLFNRLWGLKQRNNHGETRVGSEKKDSTEMNGGEYIYDLDFANTNCRHFRISTGMPGRP